jgi:hypothetical protein
MSVIDSVECGLLIIDRTVKSHVSHGVKQSNESYRITDSQKDKSKTICHDVLLEIINIFRQTIMTSASGYITHLFS